jgi:hypothetical protein
MRKDVCGDRNNNDDDGCSGPAITSDQRLSEDYDRIHLVLEYYCWSTPIQALIAITCDLPSLYAVNGHRSSSLSSHLPPEPSPVNSPRFRMSPLIANLMDVPNPALVSLDSPNSSDYFPFWAVSPPDLGKVNR